MDRVIIKSLIWQILVRIYLRSFHLRSASEMKNDDHTVWSILYGPYMIIYESYNMTHVQSVLLTDKIDEILSGKIKRKIKYSSKLNIFYRA